METNTAEARPGFDTIRTEVREMADDARKMNDHPETPVMESVALWFTMRYAQRARDLSVKLDEEAEVKLLRSVAIDLAQMQRVHLQTRRLEMDERAEQERLNDRKIAALRERKASAEKELLMLRATLKVTAEARAQEKGISVEQAREELERDPEVMEMRRELKEVQH